MTTASDQLRLDRLLARAAPAYDLQLLLERRALWTAVRLAGPLGGLRVLDLATGTGALASAMLDRGDQPVGLVAVDRSPAMLAGRGGGSRLSRTALGSGWPSPTPAGCRIPGGTSIS